MKIIVFFIAFLSAAVSANVFKCEDAAGKISYSDAPCAEDSESEAVQVNTGKKVKKYKGFNQEKYLKLSKEKRDEICTLKMKSYKEAESKQCIVVLRETGEKKCESGEDLQRHIQQAKEDYEFSCQI